MTKGQAKTGAGGDLTGTTGGTGTGTPAASEEAQEVKRAPLEGLPAELPQNWDDDPRIRAWKSVSQAELANLKQQLAQAQAQISALGAQRQETAQRLQDLETRRFRERLAEMEPDEQRAALLQEIERRDRSYQEQLTAIEQERFYGELGQKLVQNLGLTQKDMAGFSAPATAEGFSQLLDYAGKKVQEKSTGREQPQETETEESATEQAVKEALKAAGLATASTMTAGAQTTNPIAEINDPDKLAAMAVKSMRQGKKGSGEQLG